MRRAVENIELVAIYVLLMKDEGISGFLIFRQI